MFDMTIYDTIRGRHPVGEWIFIKNDDKTL